jgi:hypothetical protein
MSDPVPTEWLEEFEAARRRPLETRFRYSFIHTYELVLDDALPTASGCSIHTSAYGTAGTGADRFCGWRHTALGGMVRKMRSMWPIVCGGN